MPLTVPQRKEKLDRLLNLLQTSNYQYAKEKSGVNIQQLPPAPGTAMNCQSAARIFMQIASDMGVDRLQALYYEAPGKNSRGDKMGYLVLQSRGAKALGHGPEISQHPVVGWEFDNHWRVQDPLTGIIYDPTFGTSSPHNLMGIVGTDMSTSTNFDMTTVYGTIYKVVWQGTHATTSATGADLSPAAQYQVTDRSFNPKTMTGLR